jgi:hypothetical protein
MLLLKNSAGTVPSFSCTTIILTTSGSLSLVYAVFTWRANGGCGSTGAVSDHVGATTLFIIIIIIVEGTSGQCRRSRFSEVDQIGGSSDRGGSSGSALPIPPTRNFGPASSVRGLSMINSSSSRQSNISTVAFRACSIDAVGKGSVQWVSVAGTETRTFDRRYYSSQGRLVVWRYPGVSCRSDIVARRFRIPNRQVSQNVSNRVNLRSYRGLSHSVETEKWPRWLHPDRIGFVLFVSHKRSKALRRSSQNVLSHQRSVFLV